jgi:hypothetical protein
MYCLFVSKLTPTGLAPCTMVMNDFVRVGARLPAKADCLIRIRRLAQPHREQAHSYRIGAVHHAHEQLRICGSELAHE